MPARPVPFLAGLVLACASWPAAALAQATVSALQPDSKAAALVRLGSVKPDEVPFGQALDPGDELQGARGDTRLVLGCADASTVTFVGAFRVAVLPAAGGAPCAVNLLAGAALVNAVSPDTAVQAGEVTMASKGTLYEVRVGLDGGRLARSLLVYDGQVSVASSAGSAGGGGGGERGRAAEPRVISSGERLVMAGAGGDLARVSPRDIDRAAQVYAWADLTRATALEGGDRERALADLVQGYVRVLSAPDEPAPHLELAARQVDYHIASRATLYQLSRAERLAGTAEQHAVIALAAGAAYEQLGDASRSRTAFERATTIDPGVRTAPYLKNYRLPSVVLRGGATTLEHKISPSREAAVLGLSAEVTAASPARAGRPVAVRVVVRSTAGEPVEGATVTVAAGGGSFAGSGQTSVSGPTDAQGVFTTQWSCRPCAPAYGLDVSVTKSGFTGWKGSVTVTIGEPRPAAAERRR